VATLTALTAAAALALPPSSQARLRPLHATRGNDSGVFDDRGRQVLLRGVNVNQLGDYYQDDPSLDPVIPLRRSDFAQIAAIGFNSVRLVLSWSALEPRRGAFDERYLKRIRKAVAWARDHRLYVVLDMHQDAWGKHIATPPGETCPPGFQPAIGWDGAPRWATITDGLSTCRIQLREVSPAVAQAFTNFYADRDGIQDRLVRTWARLARSFARDPIIAGYDLLNEPHPGFAPGPHAATLLGAYYGRVIDAIRKAEDGVSGGRHHIVFFEPNVEWSATAQTATPPPSFTDDENIVFAPHLYAGSLTADRALGISALSPSEGFELAQATAGVYRTTFWSGEWGWFGDPDDDRPLIEQYAEEEDEHLVGGAWWSWKQACGDPHVVGTPGNHPDTVSPSLNRYDCPEQEPLGIPATTRRVLSRPYPLAAPGRLRGLRTDPATGAITVTGSDPDPRGSCRLLLWIARDGSGRPDFETDGGKVSSIVRVPGGWRVDACVRDDYELRRVL
jgi:endoglycosylceramidase